MKFGTQWLFSEVGQRSPKELFEDHLKETIFAEEAGFDNVWLAEHHFSEYGALGNPLVFAAALARETSKIRIGTAVMLLPLQHPLRIAEDAAMVDQLSDGRLDFGVGRGYQPSEFRGFGIPQEESSARFDESLEIIRRVWTEDRVTFKGQFFELDNVSVHPRPRQEPHPPIWVAAVSTETFARLGKRGLAILTSPNFTPIPLIKRNFDTYAAALTQGGFEADRYDRPVLLQVYVAPTEEQAHDEPRDYAMGYFKLLGKLTPGGSGTDTPKGYEFYQGVKDHLAHLDYEFLFEHGVLFGTPNQIADKIERYRSETGMNHLICWFNFGGMPKEKVERSMRLFAEEVLPRFKGQESQPARLSSTSL